MVSVSLIQASPATLGQNTTEHKDQSDEHRTSFVPASDVFTPKSTYEDHFLKWYESSHERWRWFCSRCGTNLAYTAVYPAEFSSKFPNMLDITLGSVERRYLETEALVPERHLWWDYGIDWIRDLATKGHGDLPIHPNYHIAETVNLDKSTSKL
ncbi:hypothetical protein SLS60_005191 [Paraconiothyrium brasiliense]|uniref:CENP-V/GFA domain-containing protein n=1 Tax=Paraconiothyrium brasiliense TaxID=300254 RepID=A0ABR3RH37_9PLEO